ncbi:MAG: alanine--glyoxylate aminotransferase family protein [Candidatus Neomarinimicrobiota bacterium]|nr:MAG: alanine--glyoxylate aminotransferase family protein [Candidatus Neomarinimicrobiota bacterium]
MKKAVSLFIPGPVDVAPEVAAAMTRPMIGHRSPAFADLYREVTAGIAALMSTRNPVFLSTSSATGLWEAAARNLAPRKALCCVNGAFSERWFTTIQKCGFSADKLEVEWGRGIAPDRIRERLVTGAYDVLTLVHNETSTGVAEPLEAIGRMMVEEFPDVYFAVDAVSSMVGLPIRIDDWGIDILLASVQKAWALPPGFSICIVSDRVIRRSETVRNKGYYFDFVAWAASAQKGQTIITPSIPHMYGLQTQIERIQKEGIENRYERYRRLAERTRSWGRSRGLTLFSEEGYHSDTVTCFRNTRNWDLADLGDRLYAEGYQFSNGYGKLKGSAFRIPHMGEITDRSLAAYLDCIDSLTGS